MMTLKNIKAEEKKGYIDNPEYVKSIIKDFLNLKIVNEKQIKLFKLALWTALRGLYEKSFSYYVEEDEHGERMRDENGELVVKERELYESFLSECDFSDITVGEALCTLSKICESRSHNEYLLAPIYDFALQLTKMQDISVQMFLSISVWGLYQEYKQLWNEKNEKKGIRPYIKEFAEAFQDGITVGKVTKYIVKKLCWEPGENPYVALNSSEHIAGFFMTLYTDMVDFMNNVIFKEMIEKRNMTRFEKPLPDRYKRIPEEGCEGDELEQAS